MLKKAGTLTAIVAGLMLVGAPAFAVGGEPHEEGHGHESEHGFTLVNDDDGSGHVVDQFGLLNFGNDSDVASGLNVCEIEVNAVIGVPILSNNDESLCAVSDDDGS
ncbi:hypothetical protein [Saccharothrix luteola]|uniref:hypothetical protein n=1 Tax=Saccharothrix luteola TaxID=2893018 RepID=UPI001E3185AD|nr:hypothetical protein [Saccharothrix luteola]MCC8245376.1 hypothetical protein [Saccharothrix luteola]